MEGTDNLLAFLSGDDSICLRFSSLSILKKDADETYGKADLRKKAEAKGLSFSESDDKGIASYEKATEQDGTPLLMKVWEIATKGTLVIATATIAKSKLHTRVVKQTLAMVPEILETIAITKVHKLVKAADRTIETTVQTLDAFPQTFTPFGAAENDWLHENLEEAARLGVKYGSGGALSPEELDRVFIRWSMEETDREPDDVICDALGAAFGDYFVENHDFRWAVVNDKYGSDMCVRHVRGKYMAFPRASVEKRIGTRAEFFESVYLVTLHGLEQFLEDQRPEQ